MYFSFSVDDPIALKKLKMKIYYFQDVEGILLKSEFIPSKPLVELQ